MSTDQDRPARLLAAAVRVMPAGRRDWGRAMQAELSAIDEPAERRSFARGCLRAAAAEFHLLRAAVHLLVVLGTLVTLLAWIAAVDYPPLVAVLSVVVSALAVVCWAGRRAGMLGPTGDSWLAWLLRTGGYLLAAVIVAATATGPVTDDSIGILVFATIPASFLLGLVAVLAKRSAATARVLLTGAGSGLAATLAWLAVVVIAPPIPPSTGLALALTAVAVAVAALANAAPSDTNQGRLLAALLATATTMVSIFVGVVALAHWGPDALIPNITPHALAGSEIAESRIEIIDPYVLVLVLSGVVSAALALAAVLTRRTVTDAARVTL
ncbi:hypothetical protein [Actinoplanes awajinensis]|uniref:Uncharacterized protein n=1 Tax=Actinoplanes awajinensis subsp. mycoplanecinus TaxID=135947 RepID=A0A0X3VFD9_9ACTN|nr:hypothetical protein [Actinoplanes awajinensis]KUL42066.1 hypothetical protein ADL15_02215 [Actinoplanes awajinensis subsp. mycoplanecinus]